ncbi:bile acid:sodium symporter family protein [Shewanella maritima]|uniref:Bile acid:sodium symporter family protein n=1 Tax=Shewanella maritima TaxID=2520507 RepID=A0A411PHP6_9GAMM|nr:bile acid:sodium symporter family protein [Shewanella maritima]QBF83008.1 bile acid:sodium symporter family protein [Shewanella maritima]
MTASWITQGLLPAAIAMIMFGMGLGLTLADFSRVLRWPKAVALGLSGQMLLLPALAFSLCLLLELSAEMAVGLMILSACPGGTMSNVISQLARANLALSITLTSFSTLICLITTPLLISWSSKYFLGQAQPQFSLVDVTLGLCAITLLPIALGMLVNHYFPNVSRKGEPLFRRFSALFMGLMIIAVLWQERQILAQSFKDMFLACLLLNLGSVALGLLLGRIFKLSRTDGVTLAIEVGIQNATLAMLIAMTFLNQPQLAIAAGVYGLTMYVGAMVIALWAKWPLGDSKPENQQASTTQSKAS